MKILREGLVQCRFSSWVLTLVQTKEEADKETITNRTDASQIRRFSISKKNNPKKAVRTGKRWKFSKLLKKSNQNCSRKGSSNVYSFDGLLRQFRWSGGQGIALWLQ